MSGNGAGGTRKRLGSGYNAHRTASLPPAVAEGAHVVLCPDSRGWRLGPAQHAINPSWEKKEKWARLWT